MVLSGSHIRILNRYTLTVAISLCFFPHAWAVPSSDALPVLGNIASGSATITTDPPLKQLQVNQHSDRLIANWNSFNVGTNAQVIFKQPDASSIALNRISATAASRIFGQVHANGQLIMVNPAGITIGSSGQIAASTVIASTLNINDSDFNDGHLRFESGSSSGSIQNRGSLQASAGPIILLATSINNRGLLTAASNDIILIHSQPLNSLVNLDNLPITVAASLPIQDTQPVQAQQVIQQEDHIYLSGATSELGSPSMLNTESDSLPASRYVSLNASAGTGGSGNAMPQTGWRDKGQLARLEDNWPIAYNLWKSGSLEQPASIGGTGLSSEQIKQLSTYAGWSLNANPAGDSIWYIKDGISAPTLQP